MSGKTIALTLAAAVLVGTLAACEDTFAADCADRGGVVKEHRRVATVKPLTFHTDRECLKSGKVVAED